MSEPEAIWFRNLRDSDLPALLEIERACFSDPWPGPWFRSAFQVGDLCWGAFAGKVLVGYLIATIEGDQIHLANLAVEPDRRRRGLGGMFIERLIGEAKELKINGVYLEVRCSNLEAIRLYERYGFQVSGIEELYYEGCEDALVMSVGINGMV